MPTPPPRTPLPAPDAAPGAPFADPNLKLVVLDELLSAGLIDIGEPEQFLSRMLGRVYDPRDRQRMGKCQPAYDYLARYPLTDEHLQAVESLTFDAGNGIYEFIWPGWDGETDDFDVQDLTGIAGLSRLTTLSDLALLAVDDFAPLCALPKLATLDLGLGTSVPAHVLRDLAALRQFRCYADDAPDAATLDSLRARGVTVRLYQ